jgi:hypothetical protein
MDLSRALSEEVLRRDNRGIEVRSPVVRHMAEADPPPGTDAPAAPATVGREPPARDEAAIPPFVLPELDLGAPDTWHLCRAAADICRSPPMRRRPGDRAGRGALRRPWPLGR